MHQTRTDIYQRPRSGAGLGKGKSSVTPGALIRLHWSCVMFFIEVMNHTALPEYDPRKYHSCDHWGIQTISPRMKLSDFFPPVL